MNVPITSGSKKGIDHPPCWKPPSVSSSLPPGACTTPSRLMNSLITIRIWVPTIAHGGTHRHRASADVVAPPCLSPGGAYRGAPAAQRVSRMPLKPGDKAPDFVLVDQNGDTVKRVPQAGA